MIEAWSDNFGCSNSQIRISIHSRDSLWFDEIWSQMDTNEAKQWIRNSESSRGRRIFPYWACASERMVFARSSSSRLSVLRDEGDEVDSMWPPWPWNARVARTYAHEIDFLRKKKTINTFAIRSFHECWHDFWLIKYCWGHENRAKSFEFVCPRI